MSDHSREWDNTTPLGTANVGEGALETRKMKEDLSERMSVDHYWESSVTDGDVTKDGLHKKVTLTNDVTVSAGIADAGIVYAKDVDGVAELHYMDEDDNEVQITSKGGISGMTSFDVITGTGPTSYIAYPSGYTYANTKIYAAYATVSGDYRCIRGAISLGVSTMYCQTIPGAYKIYIGT